VGVVNRYTFKTNVISSATTFMIPINLDSYPVDQAELIEENFVKKEIIKAINPIVDYETARFSPIDYSENKLSAITYSLNFTAGTTTHYNDIGFVQDDLNFERNNFTMSFLELDFYDDESLNSQNFLFRVTLFCRITSDMYTNGIIKPINTIPVSFKLDNPIITPSGISEGYYLYDYKSDVINSDKNIYMRGTFNNAKTGISTQFMSSLVPLNNTIMGVHNTFILTRLSSGFYYKIKNQDNISITDNSCLITLTKISVV
jgi:hypothetical protein